MPIVDKDGWQKTVDNNKDPYGKCAVDVAEEAMRLLDTDLYPAPLDANKLITDADIKHNLTGFLAGCVASVIAQVHSRGEEFRQAWNKHYGIDDSSQKGTVNPAIMTIKL